MHWNIDPVAFTIGPISVRWYGLLIACAMMIAIFGTTRQVRKEGINEDDYLTLFMVSMVVGVIGARVYYVLFNLPYYMQNPGEIVATWHGGLAIHGGIVFGGLTILAMCKKYKISFWQLGDIIAPFMILGQAIGRWGNFFNQEAYGYAVDPELVPWAMWIDGAYRHPTFLYESCWNLLIFFFLLWLGKQAFVRRGEVALSYFMLYSLGRVFVEGFRTDSLMLGPLRMAQVMSLLLFAVALGVMIYRRKTGAAHRRNE